MTTLASTRSRRVSLLDVEVPHATVMVDAGPGNTAVGFLRDTRIFNCAVLRPRVGGPQRDSDVTDADRELWTPAGELVNLFAPKPDGGLRTQAEIVDILRGVVRRVRYAHDWQIARYAHPGEPVYVVVEVPEGLPRGYGALAKLLTYELASMVAHDLDCDTMPVEARLCVGERHRASRNPTGRDVPVDKVYPPLIYGAWPEFGLPDVHGDATRMLPNEDVGKRRSDVPLPRRRQRDAQAVFDGGKFYWMDPRERDAFKLAGKVKRKGRHRVVR